MSDENSTGVVNNTQTSTSSTGDDFVLDFGDTGKNSNMGTGSTKTGSTGDDDMFTDDAKEKDNISEDEGNTEETQDVAKDNGGELELSFEDSDDSFNISIDDGDKDKPQDETYMEDGPDSVDDSKDSSLNDENNDVVEDSLSIDDKDPENKPEDNSEDNDTFLEEDELFEKTEEDAADDTIEDAAGDTIEDAAGDTIEDAAGDTIEDAAGDAVDDAVDDGEILIDLDDSVNTDNENNMGDDEVEDNIETSTDLNDSIDTDGNDYTNSAEIEDNSSDYIELPIDDNIGDDDNTNESDRIKNEDDSFSDSHENDESFNDSNNLTNDHLFVNENEIQDTNTNDLTDNTYSDKTYIEDRGTEYQQENSEDSIDFSQSINEDNPLGDNVDEKLNNDDTNTNNEPEKSDNVLFNSDFDKEENTSTGEFGGEFNNPQENTLNEDYSSAAEINNNFENTDQKAEGSLNFTNSDNISLDEGKNDAQNYLNGEGLQESIGFQESTQENMNLDTNMQADMEYSQNNEVNANKVENEIGYNQDNQFQDVQTQDSGNVETNYASESVDNNMPVGNTENLTKDLPQFNVMGEKDQRQNDNIEIKSTLSLDQILDSEISSNPGLINNSNTMFQDKSNTGGKSGNKKMVTTFIGIGAFVIVGILAFMAFPTLMGEKTQGTVEDPGEITDTGIEYTGEEYEEHSSASEEYSGDLEGEQIDLYDVGLSGSSSSSSVIEFPDVYTDEGEEEDPEPYQQEEFVEEYEESEEDIIDDIISTISSFKSQAEIYYSVGQDIYDKQMVKYSLRLINLCDIYQQQVDNGEGIDRESFSSFKVAANQIITDIEDYNNGGEEIEVVQTDLNDDSYFPEKDELKDYIYNR